jgi:type I restriction enzyme S subunit
MGQSPAGTSYNRTGVGVALINGPTEFTEKYPVKIQWTNQPTKLCKKGDVLLCVRGSSTGRFNISDDEYCIGRGVAAIRAKSGADTPFITFQVDSIVKEILALTTGSTFPNIDGKSIRAIPIPLPPLPEQRAIAAVLSDVDALINSLDRLITKKRDLKQATMQQLLTGHKRLPGFHGEWEVKCLGDVGTFSKGKGIKKDEVGADGMPCIRYGEIYTHHNDYLKAFNSFITQTIAQQSQRIQKGDLLFAGSGETAEEIGKCVTFLGDEEAYAGGDIVIFRPIVQDSLYFGYLMNHSSVVTQKARMGQGDAVVHISARNLAELLLHLPPLPEQTAIAAVLSDMDAEITALERRRDKTRSLKQGMMQELLTGRTRLMGKGA